MAIKLLTKHWYLKVISLTHKPALFPFPARICYIKLLICVLMKVHFQVNLILISFSFFHFGNIIKVALNWLSSSEVKWLPYLQGSRTSSSVQSLYQQSSNSWCYLIFLTKGLIFRVLGSPAGLFKMRMKHTLPVNRLSLDYYFACLKAKTLWTLHGWGCIRWWVFIAGNWNSKNLEGRLKLAYFPPRPPPPRIVK